MKNKYFWGIVSIVVVLALVILLSVWLIKKNQKTKHEGLNQRKFKLEEPEVKEELEGILKNLDVKVIRYDQEVYKVDTNNLQEEIRKLGLKYHDIFVDSTAWHDPAMVESLRMFLKDPYFVKLYQYVNKEYADMGDVESDLDTALSHYLFYFPDAQVPAIYSVVGGIDPDSYTKLVEGYEVDGKLILILHLDWYLGKDNEYYGSLPQYIRYQCDKRFLVIDCFRNVLVWEQLPNKEPVTLLDNMIAAGKVLYFTEMLFPNHPVEDIFAYTSDQLKWAENHHDDVWNYLIENELVYSKDANVARHLIDVAPETKPFKDSPGRMGSFIGWKIVCTFMENHPEISLQEMMKMEDSNDLLKKSGYKPKKQR